MTKNEPQVAACWPAKIELYRRRVTVKATAKEAGVSEFTASRALNGYALPSEAVVVAVERLTGLSRDDLFPPDYPVVANVLHDLKVSARVAMAPPAQQSPC